MLIRSLVVVGLVGLSLAFNVATAEDAGTSAPITHAIEGVNFTDIEGGGSRVLLSDPELQLSVGPQSSARFPSADLRSAPSSSLNDADERRVEVALTHGQVGGLPVDVELTQRASLGVNENGDIVRQGQGHELRLGRRLLRMRQWRGADWDHPTWYLFAASDDEALTYRHGQFAAQDRVDIGNMQAGLTMERGPVQASLAYVERKVSTQVGHDTYSTNQSFAGVTVTLRH